MARECSFRRSSVSTPAASSVPDVSVSGPVAGVDPAMSEDEDDPDFVCSSASEPGDCSGDEEVVRGASLVELASRMRKRALSETFVDVSAVIESGDLSYLSQSSLGGSQPSLSSAAEPSVPAVPESDPVPRSLPPPQKKKRFVDLPPSGFSSEQVADTLNRPYSGILPRTSYAHVCPDAVKPDVPVVMDFGYLTRSVLADIVLSNLIDLLNMFIASLPKSSLVLFLFRVLLCLWSPCPLVLLLSVLVSSFAFYFCLYIA